MSDITAAFLFLLVVGLIVVVGMVVGIIVAGRMDKLMAPRPPKPADAAGQATPAAAEPINAAPIHADAAGAASVPEEEQS